MSDDAVKIPAPVSGVGGWLDDRFHGAKGVRVLMHKVFPDHWSFMLGEIALWSFVILLLTGTYLALFFVPSMSDVVYHGSYAKLDGITMSQAYESTLNISFDIRGGLLMRQIHHWAADLFMVAIMAHMLRVFFTGAYRKPREINWIIGIVLFTLGMIEGLFGYSLPDDQLSGAGLRITEGVLQGIPIVGTYGSYFLFGGAFPGDSIIPRFYILHVFLIPGLILALITAHLFIMFHQKHTQMPALENTEKNVVGQPFFPYFLLKGQAWFFFIFGALVLLATFAQINPVWQYGPYTPLAISSASQPDFYMGILEGSLRMMPAWEINFLGHTLSLSVLIPAAVPLGIIFTGAGLWPFFEQWATGDKSFHNINDRPRNAPVRTGVGVAAVLFYGVLWAEGAQRRARRPVRHPAVHDHLDIPVRGLHTAHRRLLRNQTNMSRTAAKGRRPAHPRGRDRHHPPAAERRVRRGGAPAHRGGARDRGLQARLQGPADADRGGRQRRARPGRPRPARLGEGVRQPGLHRDRGARQRPRSRQRPRPRRPRGDRGRRARRDRRRRRRLPRGALTRPTASKASAPGARFLWPRGVLRAIKPQSVISLHPPRAPAPSVCRPDRTDLWRFRRYNAGNAMDFAGMIFDRETRRLDVARGRGDARN